MKRFTYFWAVLALITLTAGSSFARGPYDYGGFDKNQNNRMGMFYERQRPAQVAYRTILRASDGIYAGESYANSVKDGKWLMKKSKELYKKANRLYNQKRYRQAADYAVSSMCLSRAVVHVYRANHLVALPKPPNPIMSPKPPKYQAQ